MRHIGFSLVDINTKNEVFHWLMPYPPDKIAVPGQESSLEVNCPSPGDTYGSCMFVKKFFDDSIIPTINQVQSGNVVTFSSNNELIVTPQFSNISTQDLQNLLLDYSANIRYNKEVGGITISGSLIRTDRESQAKINAAYNLAVLNQANSSWNIKWKVNNSTFVPMDANSIIAISTVAGSFIQQCFSIESTVAEKIMSEEITTTQEIDLLYNSMQTAF